MSASLKKLINNNLHARFLTSICLVLLLVSCKKADTDDPSSDFDRTAMLTFYADSLILPAYSQFQEASNTLKTSIDILSTTTSEINLIKAQNDYKAAIKAWQAADMFDFGPSTDDLGITLAENINIFPTNTAKINNAIKANNTNFNNADRDARGFQALDYLLFDYNDNNQTILDSLNNVNRKNYLIALAAHLKSNADRAANDWKAYRNSFIANSGTSANTSTSMLYNTFVYKFEVLKNFKLRLPMGRAPGQTETEPQMVECYYSGFTLDMLKEEITKIENVWYGKTSNGFIGKGFKDYILSTANGEALVKDTQNQFSAIDSKLALLPEGRISALIETNITPLSNFYTEILKLTTFVKSKMESQLAIAITYTSGDGD